MKCRSLRLAPLARSLLAAGLSCALMSGALADDEATRIQALEGRLDSSLRLIEALSARLADLERAKPEAKAAHVAGQSVAPTSAQAQTQAQAQDITALQDSVAQLSDSLSKRSSDTGLPVHGFADVGAGWSSGADPQRLRGFNGGTLDLYLTPQFGQRVKSLVELAIEYGTDGGVAIDMERLQLGYTVSDDITVWMGRFHTPFGLWNTAFHHGANLQTSVFRPRFVDFEDKGGIIPAHSVGLWASGKTSAPGGKLSYDAYLANGPSIQNRTLDFNAFTDNSANKMLGLNLGYRPGGALSGLTLGLHGFASTVAALDNNKRQLSLTKLGMAGAYVGYDADDWEAIGEFYHFSNSDMATGAAHASNAGFVQLGKTFDAVTPFVRYERVSLAAADNYFLSQESGRSYKRLAMGLRYALDPRSSLKIELSNTSESAVTQIDESGAAAPFAGGSYRRAALQYSVAF